MSRAIVDETETRLRNFSAAGRTRIFLCFGNDWDGHPSSMTHIFKIIARHEPVIWVNSVGQRSPELSFNDIKRLWKKGARALRRSINTSDDSSVDGPRAVIEPKIIPYHRYAMVRRVNSALLQRQLSPVVKKWARDRSELILVTSNPVAVDIMKRIAAPISVYYCLDEYAEMSGVDAKLVRACEARLLNEVDCTFATSLMLAQSKRSRFYETVYLPQGVDFEHFQNANACPEPLRRVPHPIIGFQGIVGNRIDLVLLEKIAQRFPDASLVTLGRQEVSLAALRRYPNFYAFDAAPYSELPQWASQFDIGLIAYVNDGHTASVNPLKLLEYLAMGQAVVSVDLPELARHKEYVAVAGDHAAYLEAVGRLLKQYPFSEQEKRRRRDYARNESWENRARRFLEVCEHLSEAKRRGKQSCGNEALKVTALEAR